MARSMRLFLIRHGETVDNVAGLYAGVRDSELTNHGYQQATRLGQHFQKLGLDFSHIYSSQLQRAAKTAGKIREAQLTGDETSAKAVPDVVQLPLLQEQDFGSMEGKKFYERPSGSNITGKEHHRREKQDAVGFVDVESKDSMGRRADEFLDGHLLGLLDAAPEAKSTCVAIVSHGIFLSTLWKRLLLRLSPKSVALSPELQATARPSLEHLGGWSNTGYLELLLTRDAFEDIEALSSSPIQGSLLAEKPPADEASGTAEVPQVVKESVIVTNGNESIPEVSTTRPSHTSMLRIAHGWNTMILAINGKDHLQGLKRTGGGVGSSRHDASQKSIDTFFKRRKVG